MIYIFVYMIFGFSIVNVKSLSLISVGDASIPTKSMKKQIGELSYQKLIKDDGGDLKLTFQLDAELPYENLQLFLNEKLLNIKILNAKETPIKGQQVYISRETSANKTLYHVKFSKIKDVSTGKYVLTLNNGDINLNATAHIYSNPLVAEFTKPKLGLEGDPMRITCLFEAFPNVTEIRWERLSDFSNPDKPGNLSFVNSTIIVPDGRVKINKTDDSSFENSTLYFTSLSKNDTGIFMCVVKSSLGSDFAVIKVDVKDRWAALYPFIGIVIEVILLVSAILAYEKYQIRSQNKKNYAENVDDDNKEPAIPLAAGGGDDDNVTTENDNIQANGEMDANDKTNIDNGKQRDTATTKNV